MKLDELELGLFSAVPMLIGLVRFRQLPKYGRYIWLTVLIVFLMDLIQFSSRWIGIAAPSPITYFFVIVIFITPLHGVSYSLVHSKPIIFKLSLVVVVVGLLEGLLTQLNRFGVVGFLTLNAAFIVVCLYTFYRITSEQVDSRFFWMNGTILFSVLASSSIYVSTLYLSGDNPELVDQLLNFHAIIQIVLNFLFGASLWKLSSTSSR